MRLPGDTTYEQWDAMRRERFGEVGNMKDVTVEHLRYETCLYFGPSGNSGVATWHCSTGQCSILTRRQAIFRVVSGIRNYMMNALGEDSWLFTELGDHKPQFAGQKRRNIDSNLPWGMLFSQEDGEPE